MKRITISLFVLLISFQAFSLEIPSQISPSNQTTEQNPNVSLYINATQGATSYDFEFDLDPNFTSSTIINRTTSHCPTSDLLFGETYFWRVRAKNDTETTDWSTVWNFSIRPTVSQSAPVNNAQNQNVKIYLSWNNFNGITQYRYEYDTSPNFDSENLVSETISNSYSAVSISNLKYSGTYYWRVRAEHNTDVSEWSEVRQFTTNALGAAPSSPDNSSINKDVSLILSINKITGSTTIVYEVDTVPTFNSEQLQTYSHSDSYGGQRVSNLYYGQTYYWRVRGSHIADTSAWSETWSFTTNALGATPSSPANGSINKDVSLILSINRVAGSTTIVYEVDTVPTFNSEQLQTYSHSDSYGGQRVSNLYYGQTYYWRVRGSHIADTSVWSETWSFTTNALGASPSSPTSGSINKDVSLILSINRVAGSTTIVYEVDTVPTFNSEQLQTYSHSDSYGGQRVSNLYYGQTYYWRVRGSHIADTSAWSETWSFTTNALGATPSSPANGSINKPTSFSLYINKVDGSEYIDYQIDTSMNFNSALLQEYTHTDSYSGQPVTDLRYGQKYFWRVRGRHDADESIWSTVWDFTTEFELAEGPTLASPENNAIDIPYENTEITWTNLANIDTYQYQISEDERFTTIVKSGKTSLTLAAVGDLTPSKSYYWRVRGENINGYSPWSLIWIFNTVAVDLTPPIQLLPESNTTITENEVDLVWNEVFGASGYRVQVSLSENFSGSVSEHLTEETGYSIIGLSTDATYFWRVSAYTNTLESEWSETWSFTVFEPSLDEPQLVLPENNIPITGHEADLVWNEVFGADGYKIQVSLSESFSSDVDEYLTEETSYLIIELVADATYFWRVSAYTNTLESEWSGTWSFSTLEDTLPTPVLYLPENNATEVNIEGVIFNWDEVTEANSYTIEISEDENFNNTFYTTTTNATSLEVNELTCETTYFWRVSASNESLISDWSEIWSFTTANCIGVDNPALQTLKVYPNPAKDQITINIDETTPNTRVEIYGSLGQLIINMPIRTNFDISDLQSGLHLLQIKTNDIIIGKAKFLKK